VLPVVRPHKPSRSINISSRLFQGAALACLLLHPWAKTSSSNTRNRKRLAKADIHADWIRGSSRVREADALACGTPRLLEER
jgi:hypothetical protein